jgi:hypothetical protein
VEEGIQSKTAEKILYVLLCQLKLITGRNRTLIYPCFFKLSLCVKLPFRVYILEHVKRSKPFTNSITDSAVFNKNKLIVKATSESMRSMAPRWRLFTFNAI